MATDYIDLWARSAKLEEGETLLIPLTAAATESPPPAPPALRVVGGRDATPHEASTAP